MKIVVLDGFALNPGDLSWEPLASFGDYQIFDKTPRELVIERAKDAEILFTNKTILDKEILKSLPKIKYIGVLATGYNVVDIPTCKELNIAVTNIPAYGTKSVAQMTLAHILNIANSVASHAQGVAEGKWCVSPNFAYFEKPLFELADKTIGLIGYGQIGKEVAKIAKAFSMNVIVYSRSASIGTSDEFAKFVDLDFLTKNSDIISLHCPLTDATQNIINKEFLSKTKNGVWIINTSRGPLVDEQDLCDALNSGSVYAAGVDVLSTEPPSETNPLLNAKNCFITPHNAWMSFEARERLLDIAIDNLVSWENKTPKNLI